ncbi:MAG: hypothetical protein FWF28_09830, partial [Micrococcales bacterium]|nr:hypothetical protein [Micrococcales bacterium]
DATGVVIARERPGQPGQTIVVAAPRVAVLAATGASVEPWAAAAAVLVGLGAALVLVTRRCRPAWHGPEPRHGPQWRRGQR